MRNLNDLEKQVLKALVNHPHCSEQGLVQMTAVLNDHFIGPALGISVIVANKQIVMSIPEKDKEALRNKFLIVITVFNVLKYLTEEGLIVVLGDKQQEIGLGVQYSGGITSSIPNPIADYVEENLAKYVLVTEELRNIVSSKYRDAEHIRHYQIVIISIVAVCISFFLGLYGAYSSYTTSKELNRHVESLVISEKENTSNIVSAVDSLQSVSVDYISLLNSREHILDKVSKELEKLNASPLTNPANSQKHK